MKSIKGIARAGWGLVMVAVATALLLACAGRVLQYERSDELLKTEEYDQRIQVKPVGAAAAAAASSAPTLEKGAPGGGEGTLSVTSANEEKVAKKSPKSKRKHAKRTKEKVKSHAAKEKEQATAVTGPQPRQPDIEDSEGFEGRRPIKDPFRPGEKVTLGLSYFNITAGTMDLEVKPMVEVNGERSYQFQVTAKSNSFFNRIYGVDDTAITYVSYKDLIPFNLQITIKESKQLAEARTFFDWKEFKADYWQKKITKAHGEESKKLNWDIQPFAQNVISAVYYLRTFTFAVGKKLAFRVADEGKNIVFKGEVIRRETLSTDIGDLDTFVIKPVITVDGAFAPVGEILVWITADDRKFVVRIESKIKIGTLVARVKAIDKGQEPPPVVK